MNRFFFSCKKKRALFSRVMVVLGILVMNVMGSYNDIILWEALAGDAPSIDVIVTLSYAPVHGSDDFLKAIEDEATFGRKYRSFQKVLIKEKSANIPIS